MASVSVLIPAFNAAATLSATIASVIRQSHVDWEAIIVDDGSTDTTAANAQAWCDRDPRIRLIKGPNRGVSKARNEAARHASSPWLLFLDADDFILPTHLARLLATATAPGARPDLVYCAGAKIAADGRIGYPEIPPHEDHFKLLASQDLFYTHCCLIRRSTFEQFGGFDSVLRICEDWDLWQRFARAGAIFAGIDDCLALYQLRSTSLSHKPEIAFEDACQVIIRGHGRDPRVSNPLPALAEGQPSQDLAPALTAFACWCAGLLIGGGKNHLAFLRRIELLPIADIEPSRCVPMMYDGVPRGACGLYEDWGTLWPIHEHAIYDAFAVLEERCAIPDLAARCIKEFKHRLARDGFKFSQGGSQRGELTIANARV
jgi:glycosyltransferase involved in cell wall biosynthesis